MKPQRRPSILALARLVRGVVLLLVSAAVVTEANAITTNPMLKAEEAMLRFLDDPNPNHDSFAEEWISESTLDAVGRDSIRAALAAIHNALGGAEATDIMVERDWRLVMNFEPPGEAMETLVLDLESSTPHRIRNLAIVGGPSLHEPAEPSVSETLTWSSLRDRLDREREAGFDGVVLLVRDGEVAIEEAFGFANRQEGVANTVDTVFALGSAPIDFTLVGILMLQQEGELALSDPITKYFDAVPADKRSITIEHLMTGASGLQNFHDLPGDRDPDHTWIDREEAVRRILDHKLLFEPGTSREHSHSAWGLLAAIIEIVSGESYQEFTRTRLFEPIGMNDTGFHGDPVPADRLAIGYGDRSDGPVNAPPYWGRTSWLVMGSGGQVSTAPDMRRWIKAIHERRFLNEENTRRFMRLSRGLLNGGNDYGFDIFYTYSRDSYLILLANGVNGETRRAVSRFAHDLADLVLAESVPPYSLGIQMKLRDGRVVVGEVGPGTAAERDGLKAQDQLIGVDGEPLGDDPLAVLDPYLHEGRPIPFDVERNGKRIRIVVTPMKR
ncbi:MAG: serine hydrolase [Phycisphaerales bacterium]